MTDAIVEVGSGKLSRIPESEYMLSPSMDLAAAKKQLAVFQEFVDSYLLKDEDYGLIPGTKKPCLFKSGADKLCDVYGLADDVVIVQQVEDWDRGLFDYVIKVILTKKGSGILISTGVGSCSSFESKYRYRNMARKCPSCGKATIIKGSPQYTQGQAGFENGGWVCWKKEGKSDGCGKKFADADQSVASQIVGKSQNEDMADVKNTVLKMAKKRAKIDAVLSATRSSGVFTQDLDEIPPTGSEHSTQAAAPPPPPPPSKAAPAAAAPPPDASKGKAATTKKAAPPPPATEKTAAPPPAQAGPPKANIPPFEEKKVAPPAASGPKKELKTWAREVANIVHCSPDQTVIFMRRVLHAEDLKSAPEGQKIVCLNALAHVANMTWPGGIESVRAFVLNEGLNPDFQAIQIAYGDLLSSVSEELPAA